MNSRSATAHITISRRTTQRQRFALWLAAALALVSTLLAGPALATTILSMDIDEVAAEAELVFEGEVIEHNVQREVTSGLIHTFVTFAVSDVIKGTDPGPTLELRFTGGELDGQRVEISGLTIPALGEQGIYFVESTREALLNPLLGWSQGHFLIVEENGTRSMSTNSREPVMAIQPAANVPLLIRKPQSLKEGGSDAAGGVVTDQSALTQQQPLRVDEFKARIRELLAQ